MPAVNIRLLSTLVSCVWLVAAGCAETVGDPQFLPVPPAGETAAAARDIRDYPAALAAVADVFEREFALPRPQVTVVLFPNRRSFEQGLLTVGYEPEFARQSAMACQSARTPICAPNGKKSWASCVTV